MLEKIVSVDVEWCFEKSELEREEPCCGDCKREALRGLGVNIGKGSRKTNRQPSCFQILIMKRILLSCFPKFQSSTQSEKGFVIRSF